jgi:hypothetical protein
MKVIFLLLAICSNVVMAEVPFCSTSAGNRLTLSTSDQKFSDSYHEINKALIETCESWAKINTDPEKISKYVNNRCYELIEEKVKDKSEFFHYLKACDAGKIAATSYFEGVIKGRNEAKKCEDKTAINDLSRSTKSVEQEISNSAKEIKTTEK